MLKMAMDRMAPARVRVVLVVLVLATQALLLLPTAKLQVPRMVRAQMAILQAPPMGVQETMGRAALDLPPVPEAMAQVAMAQVVAAPLLATAPAIVLAAPPVLVLETAMAAVVVVVVMATAAMAAMAAGVGAMVAAVIKIRVQSIYVSKNGYHFARYFHHVLSNENR